LLSTEKRKEGFRLISNRAGAFQNEGQYKVFVPKDLPPDPPIKYDSELVSLSGAARQALGQLDGLTRIIRNPNHFIAMYIKKEALLSSQIEGTQASLIDVLVSEKDSREIRRHDIREVINYSNALRYGLQRVKELPFSLRLLREIHGMLLEDVRGGNRNPGEFRVSQNWIGPHSSTPKTADFVPPSVHHMTRALENLEFYYHEGKEPPLIKCGLLHAQFETIHPFLDGNGRIGRLLISFFLRDKEVLDRPLLYLSYYFKKYRLEYYDRLMAIRTDGDWEGWLAFFLTGIVEVSKQATETAAALVELAEMDRAKIMERTRTNNAVLLHEILLESPVINTADVEGKLGVTHPTARSLVNTLVSIGVLEEITGQERYRKWKYSRVIEILAEGTTVGT